MQQHVIRGVISPGGSKPNTHQIQRFDLVNEDGTPAGTVKKAAAQADSTASTVAGIVSDFNALLAKLRAAGVISS